MNPWAFLQRVKAGLTGTYAQHALVWPLDVTAPSDQLEAAAKQVERAVKEQQPFVQGVSALIYNAGRLPTPLCIALAQSHPCSHPLYEAAGLVRYQPVHAWVCHQAPSALAAAHPTSHPCTVRLSAAACSFAVHQQALNVP